ncbi:MAG: AAA family ATPase, partial [Verrucomicrobia bacterium]|nr:AAA family ATPase [Verrucomicrobiota bacterium]
MRPSAFEKVSGQREVILGLDAIVRSGKPLSLLFFGPPGCGKTTIARLYAKSFQLPLVQLSAVLNTTQELKKLLKESGESPLFQRQTIV